MLDASQFAGHSPIDVQRLDCDLLCFSGHKLGGPTGIGVCFVRRAVCGRLQPSSFGGGMVSAVSLGNYKLAESPACFESGSPAIEAAVGMAAACSHIARIGLSNIQDHEQALTKQLWEGLKNLPRLRLVGPCDLRQHGPIVSFWADGIEAHGIAAMLSNRFGIMVRSGFHCAQPLHAALGWRPTVRASLFHYNTSAEIETFIEAVRTLTAVA